MKVLESGLVAVLMLTGAACGAGTQRTSGTMAKAASCSRMPNLEQEVAQVYDVSRVRHVVPLYRSEFLARAIQPRYVAGAELYVDAEPGVSQPYFERVLTCYAAAASAAHPNDPLAVQNIQDVHVDVQGHQFVITVMGADRHAGRAIWRKAEALRDPASRIDVRQLSEADASDTEI